MNKIFYIPIPVDKELPDKSGWFHTIDSFNMGAFFYAETGIWQDKDGYEIWDQDSITHWLKPVDHKDFIEHEIKKFLKWNNNTEDEMIYSSLRQYLKTLTP